MTIAKGWRGMLFSGGAVSRKLVAVCAVATMVAAGSATLLAQTATRAKNRITQELSANTVSSVKIAGSVHPMTRKAADLGMVGAEKPLASLTLNIAPSAAQQAELNTLLAAQQDPKSAQYRKWLTQEEFGARFGLGSADLAKVTTWLKGQGFKVVSVAPSRNLITFSGTVGQAESAFRTQIHQYQLDGETHIANSTDVSVPPSLAGMITNVGGLNSFRPKARAVVRNPNPQFTSKNTGRHFLTPGDWATIYGVNELYATATGTGMHVGIVGQTYFPQSDIDKFRAAAGLPATKLNYVCISTVNCTGAAGETAAGDMGEADLDVEWAGGIAKDATVDYIYASPTDQNQGVYEALVYGITTYKVGGGVVPVISMSYGNCETDLIGTANGATAYRQQIETFLTQAATQGQTILNSSGDAGAAGCDQGSTSSVKGAIADWPASNPNVVGVGGTELNGDGSDTYADIYWSGSTSADIISSALQYIPETSWNDTLQDQAANSASTLSSGGGGVSQIYSLPPWQNDLTGAGKRYVPDVAFASSADHDGYLVCTQNFTGTTVASSTGSTCMDGFRFVSSDPDFNGALTAFGGTSAASPSFAGVVTLLVQKYGKLGNLNPMLYALANDPATYAAVFHDITTGDNKQPCTTGTGCVGGSVGYSAKTGYDLATGLGSLNAGALATAMMGTAPTTVTVTATPASVTLGNTIQLVANLSSTTTGVIGGKVTFSVGGHTLGSATVASGTATLSGIAVTTANGFSVGSDTVTAAYAGDLTFAPQSGTTTVAVAAVSSYTLTSSTPSATIAAGGSGTFTLNLVSSNYAGTVSFATAVSSSNGTAANITASVPSVTLTSDGNTTATLTISPNASAANQVPAAPWKSGKGGGAILFCAVLLGAPFTVRRKQSVAVLLTALAIGLAGFALACGGGGGSSATPVKTARTYAVTVTPTGSGTVTNPTALVFTVTVP